jgi:predicted helicase
VKAIRWASDRLGKEGIIALVTNSGFLEALAADGMRMQLAGEFDQIFVLDLGGNVRKNPKLSGTTHNVFGIQVGVSVNLFIRKDKKRESRKCQIYYARLDEYFTKEQKFRWLEQNPSSVSATWIDLQPDEYGTWLTEGFRSEYKDFLPLVSPGIFDIDSNGLKTNRDAWVYNFQKQNLAANVARTINFYNQELGKWNNRKEEDVDIDAFVSYEETSIAWSATLKQNLQRGKPIDYDKSKIRCCIYRPFTASYVYFDRSLNERVYGLPSLLPNPESQNLNRIIWIKIGSDWPMFSLLTNQIPDLLPQGGSRCLSFYAYDEDGSNRRENITDWALEEFRTHYKDKKITKWDIFHYTYGVLHDREYRERYAANLKRELPRIPYAPDFHAYAKAGKRLAEIHVEYEKQKPFKLEEREKKGKFDWRVEKMRLSKDKTMLTYNDSLTLSGIPAEVYEYRLGNRSALEWVVDQYQVSEDKRSGIVNDPNREDDPEYIYKLIGRVITVSLETVKIVKSLPGLGLPEKQLSVGSSQ